VSKSKSSELENCRNFPDSFDLMRDRCRSLISDFESDVSNLRSELDNTDRRVRNVNNSCDVNIGSLRGTAPTGRATGNKMCDVYRSYKGKLPVETLVQACAKSMSGDECKKCLSGE
jgi:hypothetical protein